MSRYKLGHKGHKKIFKQEEQAWSKDQARLGQSEAPSSGHFGIISAGGEQALIAPPACTQPEVKSKLEFIV